MPVPCVVCVYSHPLSPLPSNLIHPFLSELRAPSSSMASEPVKAVVKEVGPATNLFGADLALRFLLFATTLVAAVVMGTSKQTKLLELGPLSVAIDAKFNYSPALIYFVVANSVACFYSVISGVAAALSISKPSPPTRLLFYLALLDVLMVGVVASATGAAASIAYVGLRGNHHVGWPKVCNLYGKFCRYAGSSIAVSLIASIILILLVVISTYSLYRRSR